jgi:trans-aconitate methyltransferase
MLQKPKYLAPKYGAQFKDRSIVDAYRHRPPYPAEIFTILAELINGEPHHVLDVGCGTGNLSRYLVERTERLDAVDFSLPMLEQGKQLRNGNHPRLRWMHGSIEEIALDPPYALVTAGESLHWMDWNPKRQKLFSASQMSYSPGSILAISLTSFATSESGGGT